MEIPRPAGVRQRAASFLPTDANSSRYPTPPGSWSFGNSRHGLGSAAQVTTIGSVFPLPGVPSRMENGSPGVTRDLKLWITELDATNAAPRVVAESISDTITDFPGPRTADGWPIRIPDPMDILGFTCTRSRTKPSQS